MRKKRIFIGSSSKEIKLAKEVKKYLEPEFDVTIWKESVWDVADSVFGINENFLQSLLKATLQFDLGVLLGTADDIVKVKGKTVLLPRDNVVFELGLFMGRLGLRRCTFVVEEDIKVLSDLEGVSLVKFSKKDSSTLRQAILKVKNNFYRQSDTEVNFFPSSTLASVYFQNLIFPTCKYIIENNGFKYQNIKYQQCLIKVIIPKVIQADLNLQFEQVKKEIKTEKANFHYAGRPRFIHLEAEIKEDKLIFVDLPTILTGINYAIQYLLPNEFNEESKDYKLILSRELERFLITLKDLVSKNGFNKMVLFEQIK